MIQYNNEISDLEDVYMTLSLRNFFMIIFISLFLTSCATEQALNQPTKKDLSVFTIGTERELVLLELGSPAETIEKDGVKYDLFSFVQGYSKGTRIARATGHLLAEISTIGLWGLVGTPIEQSYNGKVLGYKVIYDENDTVFKVERLIERDNN